MIVAIIIVLFILVVISMYNSLVRKRNQIENAFSTIDVMLKRRFDLIPNLVATVQQYAKHEADTFAAITEMRNKTYTSLNDSEKADFDKMFSKVRTQFFAVAENYPELKASENFLQLQRSLNETEEQLAAARRTYALCKVEAVVVARFHQSVGRYVWLYKKSGADNSGSRTCNSGCKELIQLIK